ncbi:MAG: translation initiation factor IF-3 [Spirochaetes bacterium]|nr:translation initiation factor IF-3 [Spirochaetota bacterium]
MAEKDLRMNEGIRVREVRLIDADGTQKGIVPTFEALQMARGAGLDLVEIAPQAQPPVCKVLDYGKYKFELEKKIRESRKHQKQVRIKEIRMQPKIDGHDLEFKTRHIQEFLEEGDKVKVTVRFRGRELAHTELGKDVLDRILQMLGDTFLLEKPAQMEGRTMSLLLNPKGTKAKKG